MADNAVFVQTNDPAGEPDPGLPARRGRRAEPGSGVPTQGNGGAQEGAPSDPLASQDSLTYDPEARLLYALSAASNTISVFEVEGLTLRLTQSLPTDGDFPASVARSHGLVYVLNAGGAGSLTGYRASYLYVENGATATIHPFRVEDDGSLTALGQIGGLPRFGGRSVEGVVAL